MSRGCLTRILISTLLKVALPLPLKLLLNPARTARHNPLPLQCPKHLFSASQRSIPLQSLHRVPPSSRVNPRRSPRMDRAPRCPNHLFSASQRSIPLQPLRRIPPSNRVNPHPSPRIIHVLQHLSRLFSANQHPIPLQSLRRLTAHLSHRIHRVPRRPKRLFSASQRSILLHC